jgi:branched-chain amino acid transport system substrate-binding protein
MQPSSSQRSTRFVRGFLIFCATLLSAPNPAFSGGQNSGDDPLAVYLNADLTHTPAVGDSIRLGFEAGLLVGAERYGGPPITLHVRDHRNNLRRTSNTVAEATGDPATLALVGGMHTPHYLKHGPAINEQGLVLLLPWSAGAALTRLVHGEQNHIFRLSVDDHKAAPYLAEQAVSHGCSRVATLALDNGWGRGNAEALGENIKTLGAVLSFQGFVRRDAGEESVAAEISTMANQQPDCVILILDGRLSALAANNLVVWDRPPDVLSHWGILGGGFGETATPKVWSGLDIAVLSTCVLYMEQIRSTQVREALAVAARLRASATSLRDLPSPIGFAHAYDIGLLLRAAVPQAQADPRWNMGRSARGAALRDALETLETPVDGLLKRYSQPYTTMGPETPDAHEALGRADLCLTRKRRNGRLEAHTWRRVP